MEQETTLQEKLDMAREQQRSPDFENNESLMDDDSDNREVQWVEREPQGFEAFTR